MRDKSDESVFGQDGRKEGRGLQKKHFFQKLVGGGSKQGGAALGGGKNVCKPRGESQKGENTGRRDNTGKVGNGSGGAFGV